MCVQFRAQNELAKFRPRFTEGQLSGAVAGLTIAALLLAAFWAMAQWAFCDAPETVVLYRANGTHYEMTGTRSEIRAWQTISGDKPTP